MKSAERGFITPVIILITIIVLSVGGWFYVHTENGRKVKNFLADSEGSVSINPDTDSNSTLKDFSEDSYDCSLANSIG